MPKVTLTDAQRRSAIERRADARMAYLVRSNKARTGDTDLVLSIRTDISRTTIYRYKHPEYIYNASFGDIRRLAHEMGLSKAEWLAVGGFDGGDD